jgi:hypothetical protein
MARGDGGFKPGQSGNPNGRPPGSRNKKDIIAENLTSQAISEGILPLDLFLHVMRDVEKPLGVRFECAKAAAPYVHRKMPIAIETDQQNFRALDITTLQGLSLDELQTMGKLMAKAHAASLAEKEPKLDPRVVQKPAPKTKPTPKPKAK